MTPADLAARVPRLYHVTAPDALDGIRERGLLSARAALDLFEETPARTARLTGERRPGETALEHRRHGRVVLNDNIPFSADKLAPRLDDGLTPADWLRLLNGKVFFFPDEKSAESLLMARTNRARDRVLLVFDTKSLVGAHVDRTALSPINSGSTLYVPARRGLATFTPLAALSYRDWQRQRGGRDTVKEVTVERAVPDAWDHLIEARHRLASA